MRNRLGPELLGVALLAGLHALAFGLMFPPLKAWWLAPLAMAPLVAAARLVARGACSRRGMRRLAAGCVVFAVCTTGWLITGAWMRTITDAGWPALAVYMGLFPTAFTWAAWRMQRSPRTARIPLALAAGVLWGGLEAARALILFDGYPWHLLAHPLIDAPWVPQAADLLGVGVLSALCAATGGALVEFRRRGAMAVVAALWIAAAVYGAWRLQAPLAPGPTLLLVQTNLPTSNKNAWTPQAQLRDVPTFVSLTRQGAARAAAAGVRLDLAVWPETMLPGYGLEPETIRLQVDGGWFPGDVFSRQVTQLQESIGVPLVVGSASFRNLRPQGDRWAWDGHFNSAYLVGGPPPWPRYDKLFLTPFGETMPYIRAWPALQQALLDIGAKGMTFDLRAGQNAVRFNLPGPEGMAFAVPICFEDTMAPVCRRLAIQDGRKVAPLLVNISNDGWFGDHDAGRRTHVDIARWRAIELRVSLARAANTGLSAVVDPMGRVRSELPPKVAECLVAPTWLDPRVTLYARVGEVGSHLLVLGALIMIISTFVPSRVPASGAAVAVRAGLLAALCLPVACAPRPTAATALSTPPPKTSSTSGGGTLAAGSKGTAGNGGAAASRGAPLPGSRTEAWSTRDRSITPEGAPALADEAPAQPVAPGLAVTNSGDARGSAVELLRTAAGSPDALRRAHAIELLAADPELLEPVARRGLVDPNRGVRFVAAMAIGKAKLVNAATLVSPLLDDPSLSVRAAAIYALVRCGQPVDQSPLAEMIRSDDLEVRGNALLVMGELGNPSAIQPILSSIGVGMGRASDARRRIADLQAAEAMAKLGDDQSLEPIRAALFAPSEQSEVIALGCQMAGRLRDERAVPYLQVLAGANGSDARPPEVRLLAVEALGGMQQVDRAQAVAYAKRFMRDKNRQLRAGAIRVLAASGGDAALPLLEPMLYDKDPLVQVAAAGAILSITSSSQLSAGAR